MEIGKQIHDINLKLNNLTYKISYSAKTEKYSLFDTKLNYKFYDFNGDDLKNLSYELVQNIITRYKYSPKFATALQLYEKSMEQFLKNLGLNLMKMEEGKLVVKSFNQEYTIRYKPAEIQNYSDLKTFVVKSVRRIS